MLNVWYLLFIFLIPLLVSISYLTLNSRVSLQKMLLINFGLGIIYLIIVLASMAYSIFTVVESNFGISSLLLNNSIVIFCLFGVLSFILPRMQYENRTNWCSPLAFGLIIVFLTKIVSETIESNLNFEEFLFYIFVSSNHALIIFPSICFATILFVKYFYLKDANNYIDVLNLIYFFIFTTIYSMIIFYATINLQAIGFYNFWIPSDFNWGIHRFIPLIIFGSSLIYVFLKNMILFIWKKEYKIGLKKYLFQRIELYWFTIYNFTFLLPKIKGTYFIKKYLIKR